MLKSSKKRQLWNNCTLQNVRGPTRSGKIEMSSNIGNTKLACDDSLSPLEISASAYFQTTHLIIKIYLESSSLVHDACIYICGMH